MPLHTCSALKSEQTHQTLNYCKESGAITEVYPCLMSFYHTYHALSAAMGNVKYFGLTCRYMWPYESDQANQQRPSLGI